MYVHVKGDQYRVKVTPYQAKLGITLEKFAGNNFITSIEVNNEFGLVAHRLFDEVDIYDY